MNGILRQFQNPLPSREGGEGALQEADKAQFSSQFAIASALSYQMIRGCDLRPEVGRFRSLEEADLS